MKESVGDETVLRGPSFIMPPIISNQPGNTMASTSDRPAESTHRHSDTICYAARFNTPDAAPSDGQNGLDATNRKSLNAEDITLTLDLSNRREIVELLDAEPTFDYLVQNGVLSREDVATIVCEPDTSSQNRRFLKLIETHGDMGSVRLLTNVLRLTGQHYIANMLDDGARIRALSGSGYLSKSRHKGQVNVTVRIRSIQLPADPHLRAVSEMLGKEWISLEDIQMKMSSLKRSQQLHIVTPVNASPVVSEIPDEEECCCWCCCCGCYRPSQSTTKKPDKTNSNANTIEMDCRRDNQADVRRSLLVTYQPLGQTKSASIECMAVTEPGTNVDNLRHVADHIQARCMMVYSSIAETGTELRVGIERYFEQERGVLFLGAESLGAGGGAVISCICTRLEDVNRLRADKQEKLISDIEKVINRCTGAQLRLLVTVDDNDLDLAESELRSA